MTPLVSAGEGVTLVGGGAVTRADIDLALAHAPVLVAADSGADHAMACGHTPEAVIGDLDSVSDATRAALPPDRLHRIAEQETTDFEKCLARIAAPFVVAVGFAGPRVDHLLAAFSIMARHRRRPVLILLPEEVAFILPPSLSLPLEAGTRVSLWPLGPVQGRSRGLRWPIDSKAFAPDGRVGTSNEATGPVTLEVQGPMLALLPRDLLAVAVTSLR